MRFLSSIIILLTITAFLWAADAPPTFTVTSQAPGNVVTTGTPLIFTVQGADGAVQYTVTDYFGKTVVTNSVTATNGMATITAPMLPPGFYTLDCTNGTQHVTVSLGVLINRGNAPLPRVGRIGTDAALTWLTSLENIPKIAHMVRLAGIPWVRERLAWRDIEQAQGAQTWTEKNPRYQAAADAYAREGVYVESMWHDAPDWTHQGLQGNAYGPDDLRTAYAFARDAASHYASAIQTWEIWNEPDIGFWKDLSDRFAGYEKATYLGIKAGDSKLQAFPGALCSGYSNFGKHLYESISGYGDGFAWHVYDETTSLGSSLDKKYTPMYQESAMYGLPVRLTECGIHVPVIAQGSRLLSAENQRQQCRFMPRMAACGLAAGNEKVFYFVLPDYMEGQVQYGLLHRDMTPNPGFIALSAAANLIGESTYLGTYRTVPGVSAYAFTTPRGPVLVAWAEKDTTLTVPTDKAAITMANIFGDTHTVSANHGTVSVNVGPEAEYLIGIGTLFTKQLNTPAPPVKAAKAATPAPIIVVGHDDRSLPINRQRDGYLLSKITADGTLAPFTYQVDVYNFSKTSVRGTIKLALPSGWKASTMSNSVTIPAMGRVTCPVTITPQAGMQYAALTVTGSFGDMHVAPSTSYFMVDAVPMLLHAAKHQSLAWADAARWKQNNAVIAPTTVTNRDPETLQLSTTFTQQGDRWVYPTINFTPPMDMSAYDYALTFDYQCDVDSPTSGLHMMFVEPNGATYMSSNNLPVTTKAQHGIVYFHDLNWLNLSAKDDNGHLDLNRIAAVRFGGNFAAKDLNHVTITVKNFQLLATPADLPIIAEAEKGTYSTGWGVTNNAGYSGSKYLNLWENTDPDEKGYWADVPFTVPVTGRYDLYFSGNTLSRLASPCSISPFSWTVDNGKVQQADVPRVMKDVPGCYMLAEIPCLLDTVPLTAGPHVFHLRITTRRMTGDHYYALWFDAIMLQRVDSTAKTK